ncbi:extracellular solute-binding protein [Streptococcus pneumoniae]|nr:extracellular solute-binding protein [Streptococcus pneumoniae]
MNHRNTAYSIFFISNFYKLILFENQIQTTATSPYRTQVQPAASFLVCSLINSQVFEIRIFNSYYKDAIYYFKNINYSIFHIFSTHY